MELQSVSRLSGGPPPSRSPARSFESPVRGWQRRPSGGNHGGGGGGHNQSGDALDTTLELDSSDIYGHFEQFGAKALSTLGALGGAGARSTLSGARGDDAPRGPLARRAARLRRAWAVFARRARAAWSTHYFWLFLAFLALGVSVAAYLMDASAAALHKALVKGVSGEAGRPPAGRLAGYVAARVAVTLVAVELTRRVSPIAAGSGIPETKSVLAGFSLPGFLTLRTLVAKVGGVVLLLGAGLPVGKEGPFIHTAAIFAEQLLSLSYFRVLNDTPEFRHQMLSAAAAVGVSAAFGAPIGGIMFSIEATATFYVTAHYWGAFFAATCGAFVSRELGYDDYAAFSPNFKKLPYKHWEMPLFFLLAAFGGLLGGLYVKLFTAIVGARRSCAEARDREPAGGAAAAARGAVEACVGSNLGFSALAAGLSGVAAAGVGDFMHLGTREVLDDLFSDGPLARARNGHIHERSKWEDQDGGVVGALVYFVLFTFAFSAACVGLPASNGLVTPSFAIGAGVGRLYGEVLRFAAAAAGAATSPFSPAGGYAIVGAAAFSVSVTGKISIGVVICELTGQLSYAIPVLFACVLGLAAGQVVEIDIYSMIARMKRLPHWPTLSAAADFALTVDDVFDRDEHLSRSAVPLRTLTSEGGAAKLAPGARRHVLERALRATTHGLLPVVLDGDSEAFVGAVRAVDVDVALQLAADDATGAAANRGAAAPLLDVQATCDVDFTWPRVSRSASLNYACFLFALYQCGRVYVVDDRGALVGYLDSTRVEAAVADRRGRRRDGDEAHAAAPLPARATADGGEPKTPTGGTAMV